MRSARLRSPFVWLAGLGTLFAGAGDLAAAPSPRPTAPPLLERPLEKRLRTAWREQALAIDEQLRAGNCQAARVALDPLFDDMTEHLTGGEGAGKILAVAVTLRALAHACLDAAHDAVWDFHVSRLLDPGGIDAALPTLGELGAKLAAMVLAEAEAVARSKAELAAIAGFDEKKLTPPRKEPGSFSIVYPASLRSSLRTGVAHLEAFVDTDGRLKQPTLGKDSTPNAVFLYAALDGARTARFRPATYDERVVGTSYSYKVSYKLTR